MNKIAKRTILALILAAVLVTGMSVIILRYLISSGDWVTAQNSPHVYSDGVMNCGVVQDRNGTTVLDATNGKEYAESASARKSMLHLLGDREGNVSPFIMAEYGEKMIGFDRFNGVYSYGEAVGTMKLTVSAEVQRTALAALDGRKGIVGVYNYRTGEILCMVSSPTFDPDNVPDVVGNPEKYDGVYVNRFLHSTYTPGSVFKVVTAAAALEQIDDIDERTFFCEGEVVLKGETLVCNGVHGEQTFEEALANSCNVAFGELAAQLGPEVLTDYAKKAGVLSRISFDGTKTAAGNFDLTDAAVYEGAWAGIGQYTDQINPCQYMTFMGAVANKGVAAKPYLVEEIYFGESRKYSASVQTLPTMLRSETADRLAEMMHYAVEEVYGNWHFSGMYAGAKSGTAEVGNGQEPHALFAGFVQDEDYPLAFIVIVENGGGGSSVCAPIISKVLDACVVAMDIADS